MDGFLSFFHQIKPDNPGTPGYDAPNHSNLLKKNVRPHGVKQLDGNLLIPVRDSGGILNGLQKIKPDGTERFEPGTAVSGHRHFGAHTI